ncbi:hypothetical protein IEQ34_001240 [Dendrobium chrysotoxum]|uniref:Uncharacterized protein n=1 Tax=Dendrobium chrysotoxum TaxID=161865 RepID=A0AAV7HPX0_DENCH|nr:hypothetical protein IEQ34_001240 [Dendrobium chrysotoxum]
MPTSAPGSRKTRRRFCLPSCFSSSAVYDPDDSPALPPEKAPGRSPETFLLARACRQNKTVPLLMEIAAVGEGQVKEGRDIKREVSPSVISPAANHQRGMPEKLRKVEKRCKITGAKPFTHKPLSTCSNKRSNNQISCINNNQSKATLHKVNRHGPIQTRTRTRTNHSVSPDLTLSIHSTRASSRLDMLIGLIMVAMMLVMILIGGKIFAVFITTTCFYLFSCFDLSRSPSPQKIITR